MAGIAIALILGACISKDAAALRSSLALGALLVALLAADYIPGP